MASATDVGSALRRLREARGLDQVPLGELAGISARTIGRVETGAGPPNFQTVHALLTAMGLTLHDLAEALDEVAGRSAPARARKGKVQEHRVRFILQQGGVHRSQVASWVADALADEMGGDQKLADLGATLAAAAEAILEAEVHQVREDRANAKAIRREPVP